MWALCGPGAGHAFDMVSLCPSMVFGPPRNLAAAKRAVSVQVVEGWAFGGKKIESRLVADVRDVARAHVVAATAEGAGGNRYILSSEARVPADQTKGSIATRFPELAAGLGPADSAFSPAIPIGTQEVDVAPTLRDLPGTSFRDPDETVNDTIDLMLRER